MLDLPSLIGTCSRASLQIDKQFRQFEEFTVRAHEVLTGKDFQVRDIAVKLKPDAGRFSANLLHGPEVHFVFSSHIDAQGATRGFVKAYVRTEFSPEPYKQLGEFSFNSNGELEERDNFGDLLEIGSGNHAAGLVLRFLQESLKT